MLFIKETVTIERKFYGLSLRSPSKKNVMSASSVHQYPVVIVNTGVHSGMFCCSLFQYPISSVDCSSTINTSVCDSKINI